MRLRSGHGKAKPQPGRISALCGPLGPLTGVLHKTSRPNHWQPLNSLVTSSSIKSDVVPGLWPGRRRFSVVGRGWMVGWALIFG
ncbi:hypothetical protein PV820_004466 [Salmonella enterica]|nr:hypothetical protein [Salmonella enterica]EIU0699931.1 hypothetical protein [Salmonella enterica]EKK6441742.1 hypothetical protein [Salmonella enterica]EKN0104879.1 hypothetical protein [Salmonella enterica]ELV7251528.1 hypothetical protein [Salmonella enterica]